MLKVMHQSAAHFSRSFLTLLVAALLSFGSMHARAQQNLPTVDPLNSSMWDDMHQRLLGGLPVVFDERVKVIAPGSAEDSMNVPVKVDASALGAVRRMVVFAELNPIPRILEMQPGQAVPAVSFNFKVQQATPLRAAALDEDGVWHVGSVLLDASGGGCTQPSVGSANADWSAQLGKVTARLWPRGSGQRLRLRVMHPMDTGLADHIPVFHIERLEVNDRQGNTLAALKLYEPVSENPTLTLDLESAQPVDLYAVDNNGNQVHAVVLGD